jgi:hypothetical protein
VGGGPHEHDDRPRQAPSKSGAVARPACRKWE